MKYDNPSNVCSKKNDSFIVNWWAKHSTFISKFIVYKREIKRCFVTWQTYSQKKLIFLTNCFFLVTQPSCGRRRRWTASISAMKKMNLRTELRVVLDDHAERWCRYRWVRPVFDLRVRFRIKFGTHGAPDHDLPNRLQRGAGLMTSLELQGKENPRTSLSRLKFGFASFSGVPHMFNWGYIKDVQVVHGAICKKNRSKH
jgi:hypothetical protein